MNELRQNGLAKTQHRDQRSVVLSPNLKPKEASYIYGLLLMYECGI